jgi:hypothetical protein
VTSRNIAQAKNATLKYDARSLALTTLLITRAARH